MITGVQLLKNKVLDLLHFDGHREKSYFAIKRRYESWRKQINESASNCKSFKPYTGYCMLNLAYDIIKVKAIQETRFTQANY